MADERTTEAQGDKLPVTMPAMVEESDGGLMLRWNEAATTINTNITQGDARGRALLTRCLATADLKTRQVVGQVVEAVAYMAHVVEIVDESSGEVSRKVRVVLVLKDGRTLSTSSKACVRALSIIAHSTDNVEWNPPIMLEFREFPLEGGRSYCDLREIVREKGRPSK